MVVRPMGHSAEGRISGNSLKSPSSIAVPSAKSTVVMPCPCVALEAVSAGGLGSVLGETKVWRLGPVSSTIIIGRCVISQSNTHVACSRWTGESCVFMRRRENCLSSASYTAGRVSNSCTRIPSGSTRTVPDVGGTVTGIMQSVNGGSTVVSLT